MADKKLSESIKKFRDKPVKMQRGGTPDTLTLSELGNALSNADIDRIQRLLGSPRANPRVMRQFRERLEQPTGNTLSDADVSRIMNMMGMGPMSVRNRTRPAMMEDGGAVPAKFKGFSMLPEKVQKQMNPDLAQKYEGGGEVRGARSAIRGRGFKGIR